MIILFLLINPFGYTYIVILTIVIRVLGHWSTVYSGLRSCSHICVHWTTVYPGLGYHSRIYVHWTTVYQGLGSRSRICIHWSTVYQGLGSPSRIYVQWSLPIHSLNTTINFNILCVNIFNVNIYWKRTWKTINVNIKNVHKKYSKVGFYSWILLNLK